MIMNKMKRIYPLLVSLLVLPLSAFGQEPEHNTYRYDDVEITHKRGQWYENGYQDVNPRNNNTATNSDSFNEDVTSEGNVQPGWMDSWEGTLQGYSSYPVQAVHVYRATVYVNDGQTKQITLPGVYKPDDERCVSMYNYQRWYNYLTDGKFDNSVLEPILYGGHGNAYDFANGLVGGTCVNGLTSSAHTYGIYRVNFRKTGSNVEYLACDVSSYNDFEDRTPPTSGYNPQWEEPTLSQRCIFEVRDADEIKELLRNCTGDTYFEDKIIHLPLRRITTRRTLEQVALDMPANNYFVPGENGANPGALTISISGGGNFITRSDRNISGEDRVISFNQSTSASVYRDYAGRTVTITVTKNGYNIARFRLVFDDGVQGVLREELNAAVDNPRNEYYERTESYLRDNYELLTQLNFDFDNADASGDNHRGSFYPYPLEWSYSTYGFYSDQNQLKASTYPQWGEYGITNIIPWGESNDEPLHPTGYHLYVDANERPGTVCELPFDTPLCPATRLYVTAYIKSLGDEDSQTRYQDDAGVIFVLKGIDTDENGNEVETVLHRQSSGQIPYSDADWYQLYFSFTSEENAYEHYVLEIQNNCASTSGGDFCIDDISIYISPLEVEAKTLRPLCSSELEAEVQISLNYDLLLDRLGLTEGVDTDVEQHGYYSFLDKAVYDAALAGGQTTQEAFEASVIHGDGVYGGTGNEYYGTFTFYTDPAKNSYDGTNGERLEMIPEGANRFLAFTAPIAANQQGGDLTTLQSGGNYYILFTNSVTVGEDAAAAYELESPCGMRGEFTVTGPLIINVSGDVQTNAATVCMGQVPLIDVQMRDGEGNVVDNAVFDWYFGNLTSFRAEETAEIQSIGRTHTLKEALDMFRYFYPDATSVTDDMTEQVGDANHHLYQEDLDLIRELNEDHTAGGQNPRLTLSASSSLAIRLMNEATYVVLVPIGELTEGVQVCWEPTQMILYAQDGAPIMDVGRNDVDYSGAGTDYAVQLRIAKSQLDIIVNDNLHLYVPVRDPRLIGDAASSNITVTNNNPSGGEFDRNVYIEWTDDPDLDVGSGDALVVGTVDKFSIAPNATATKSRVRMRFNDNVTLREGYEYQLMFKFRTNAVSSSECDGNVLVPLLIVPDYEVWTGTATDNWNDDSKWRRAEPSELNKNDGYETNGVHGTEKGFVPLRPTKVVIPAGGQSMLYQAGSKMGTGRTAVLDLTNTEMGNATDNIEYDLTVRREYQGGQPSSTYYYVGDVYETNLCDQIHFDYGGEMLHSELLTHNRAWTEVNLPTKQWTLVSTPLNGVYSGDWYTKTSGDETAEYFTDLKFGTDNNRLKPLMTQRSWDGNAKVVSGSNNASAVVSNVTWSSTFNDVAVPYQPGMGFSIHANMGSSDNGKGVTFRMPKSDASYDGFDQALSRDADNFGKLATSDMAALAEGTDYEVEITPSQDGNYIIIGNPFVSHLSAKAFFEANSSVLQGKYWTANDDYPKAGVADDNGNWQTTDGTDAALIPPYTAFYAQLNSQSTQSPTINIKFNTSMAALGTTTSGDTPSTNGLVISAAATNGKSSTLLSYKTEAVNGFADSEDVQLLNESDSEVPMVYTVAGDIATSINRIKDAQQIPLGVFAADDDVTTLTFTGVAALMEPSLYDAEMNTDTPLTEGYTLTVNGASHGRYFIRAKGAGEGTTGITDVETGDGGVSVYSVAPRQVVVSSGAELLEVSVYSVGGAMLGHESVGGGRTAVTLDGIDSGVAVVRVVTADGQTTRKLVVK